jgi:hypothetical protein
MQASREPGLSIAAVAFTARRVVAVASSTNNASSALQMMSAASECPVMRGAASWLARADAVVSLTHLAWRRRSIKDQRPRTDVRCDGAGAVSHNRVGAFK